MNRVLHARRFGIESTVLRLKAEQSDGAMANLLTAMSTMASLRQAEIADRLIASPTIFNPLYEGLARRSPLRGWRWVARPVWMGFFIPDAVRFGMALSHFVG